jgi:hypothetical protein
VVSVIGIALACSAVGFMGAYGAVADESVVGEPGARDRRVRVDIRRLSGDYRQTPSAVAEQRCHSPSRLVCSPKRRKKSVMPCGMRVLCASGMPV